MKKIAIISFVLLALWTAPILRAQAPPSLKTYKLQPAELAKIGIQTENGKVWFLENLRIKGKQQLRKVMIGEGKVEFRKANAKEKANALRYNPRFAVMNFLGGSAGYFVNIEAYRQIPERNKKADSAAYLYPKVNELICFAVRLEDKDDPANSSDVYIYFEPKPDLLDALPDELANTIKEDIGHPEPANSISNAKVYPNPATSSGANLSFTLAKESIVSIAIYDINGKMLMAIDEGRTVSAGSTTINFMTSSLTPGMYLIAITTAAGEQAVQRLIIIN